MNALVVVLILLVIVAGIGCYYIIHYYETRIKSISSSIQREAVEKEDYYKGVFSKAKITIETLTTQNEELLKEIDSLKNKNKNLMDENKYLEERTSKFQDDTYNLTNVSYRNTEVEISRRITEAVAIWQDKVAELESRLELRVIQGDSPEQDDPNHYQKIIEENRLIKDKLTKKEEENVDLSLKMGKTISAYEALNERYKKLIGEYN